MPIVTVDAIKSLDEMHLFFIFGFLISLMCMHKLANRLSSLRAHSNALRHALYINANASITQTSECLFKQ